MGILEKIKSIDQFGAFFQLSIQGDNPQYKSLAGAIATFLLNSSALAYLSYLFYMWITNQSVPSVATEQIFKSEGNTFYLSQPPFTFNIEMYDNESLKEYRGQYYYNVSRRFFMNGEVLDFDEYHPKCEKLYFMDLLDDPVCIDLSDPYQKKLTQLYSNRLYDDYLGFFFNPCSKQDPKCISEDVSQDFLENLDAEGRLTMMSQQYQLDKEEIATIPFDYYFPLSFSQQNVFNLVLTPTKLTVIKGIFFPTEIELVYISKIDLKFIPTLRTEGDSYIIVWVSLDRSQIQTRIEYPRLPQILAQFSSLFSALMGLGILFNMINGSILRKQLVGQIGEIYFTNFKKLVTQKRDKNYFNLMNKKKMENIKNQLLQKCNFLNIIYEISRIQFALQTLLTKQHLIQIQKMKYSINENGNMRPDDSQYQALLTEENFETFTMNRKISDDSSPYPNHVQNLQNHIDEIIRSNIPYLMIASNGILSSPDSYLESGNEQYRINQFNLPFKGFKKFQKTEHTGRVQSCPGDNEIKQIN